MIKGSKWRSESVLDPILLPSFMKFASSSPFPLSLISIFFLSSFLFSLRLFSIAVVVVAAVVVGLLPREMLLEFAVDQQVLELRAQCERIGTSCCVALGRQVRIRLISGSYCVELS